MRLATSPMPVDPGPSEHAGARGAREPLQAALLLLPALVLAWPGAGSPIARDFATTELTATGVAALALLPAALFLFWRVLRGLALAPGAVALFAALFGAALFSAWLARASDAMEQRRALLWMASGLVAALGGAHLGAAGRRTFARGAAAIALLLLAPATFGAAGGHGGVLHNSGELSNAALPGALCGAALFALGRSPWRELGLLAAALFVLHAALAPVLAGLLALALAAGIVAGLRFLGPGARQPARALLALAAAAVLAFLWAVGGKPLPGAGARIVVAPSSSADLGGVEVRRRVARATFALVADHALLGVGPGQFAASFPPYRDPLEIEASSHGRRAPFETEVEHPHDDHLAIVAEIGLFGGLAWLVFALLVARASLRRARSGDAAELGLAAAALGALAIAFTNGTLSYNPAASTLAFATFGAVLGPGRRALPRGAARALCGALALGVTLFGGPAAWKLVRHGLALSSFAGEEEPRPAEVWRGVSDALAAAPDSVTARTLRARYLAQTGASRADVMEAWRAVLALRPHRLEALVQLGVLHAEAEELDAARPLFETAAALDPGHPAVLRNRVRLALSSGALEEGVELLEELRSLGGAGALWLRDLGTELLCRGLDREAEPVLAHADERFGSLDAEAAYELSRYYRRTGARLAADGFECQAHRLWASEHAEAERWDEARRVLRQALRISRDHVPGGGPRLRLELAAALWRSGRREEAREEMGSLRPNAAELSIVPAWARDALVEMGHEPPD